ncbi:MAG TPA: methyltransferase domain-containing protein [Steroidobacteraceae bacterium]|nr:methyltransferase domain-containing protein [Steroidobacteraceae bacterium]
MKTPLLSCLLLVAIVANAADPSPVEKSIASPERTAADRERDLREKPAEVMAFAGVKPGMVVADIFAAGGYYTELLAGVVGPGGKVLAINNIPYATYAKDDIKARFTEGRLGNVERRIVEASYMNIKPASVDLVVIVMAYHDAYWIDEKEGWPEINTDGFLESIHRMLKPGGKLLIIDHNAAAGTGREVAGKLHRLNEDWAKKSITSHGFVFEKSWDGLRNPKDQFDKMVYDAAVKGKTDRYVHLYRAK